MEGGCLGLWTIFLTGTIATAVRSRWDDTMSHPLEQQIARLRRKVGLLVWLHGLSWLVAATLAAFLAVGLLDYLCHFSLPLRKVFADTGIRVICSLLVAGVALWVA